MVPVCEDHRVTQASFSQPTKKPEGVLGGSGERNTEPDGLPRVRVNRNPNVHWSSATLYNAFIHRDRSVPALHWLEAKLCLNLFHPILNARLGKRLGEKPEESRGFSEAQPKREE